MKNQRNGFTLIELVVVMAIIAVLAALIVGAIVIARRTAIETAHRSNAKTIKAGLEAYFASKRSYPTTNGAQSFVDLRDFCGGAVCPANGFQTAPLSGVQLTSAPECYINGTGPKKITDTFPNESVEGGGTVEFNANGYTIRPVNYDCSEFLLASDNLIN